MDTFSPLVTFVVAVSAAILTYVFSRRAETLRALREARTSWAVGAINALNNHIDDVGRVVFDGEEVDFDHKIPEDPDLQVLDPVGYRLVRGMIYIHGASIENLAPGWQHWQFQGGVSSLLPPQLIDAGRKLDDVIALWCRASVWMPSWRLRWVHRRFFDREDSWAGAMHGQTNRKMTKASEERDRKQFDEMMLDPFAKPSWWKELHPDEPDEELPRDDTV